LPIAKPGSGGVTKVAPLTGRRATDMEGFVKWDEEEGAVDVK
jgi:hypothetical protein